MYSKCNQCKLSDKCRHIQKFQIECCINFQWDEKYIKPPIKPIPSGLEYIHDSWGFSWLNKLKLLKPILNFIYPPVITVIIMKLSLKTETPLIYILSIMTSMLFYINIRIGKK